jgi:hypothetical protein
MRQNYFVATTRVHQGVGQDRQMLESTLFVDRSCKTNDVLRKPVWCSNNLVEWIADNVMHQVQLFLCGTPTKPLDESTFRQIRVNSATANNPGSIAGILFSDVPRSTVSSMPPLVVASVARAGFASGLPSIDEFLLRNLVIGELLGDLDGTPAAPISD